MLAEKAMAEEQARITKHGSFILQYQEADIISEELLKKEAVRTPSVCLSVCQLVCVFVPVSVCVNRPASSAVMCRCCVSCTFRLLFIFN